MTARGVAIVALLASVVTGAAPGPAPDPQELLAKVDISYGRYGKTLFGPPKVRVFTARDGSVILAHQARYGGDGDHSENRLMLFGFQGGKARKLLDQNIDFVEFVEVADILRLIRGKDVESLCDVCDGWGAAEVDDVFFIPIVVDVETLTVRVDLSEDEKQRLLSRVEQRAARNLAEMRKHGRDYGPFAASVTGGVRSLLTGIGPTAAVPAGRTTILAVAAETKRDWADPTITVVRVAFAKTGGGWAGFPDQRHGHASDEGTETELPLPRTGRWDACFDGRRIGTVSTVLVPDLGAIALTNVHQPASGERVPFKGKPSIDYSGWLNHPVHRPLILVSAGSCSDPGKWKPSPVPREVLAVVIPAFRDAVEGISGCDADGKSAGPYEFPASEIVVGKSYASAHGDRIVTLSVRQRREVLGGCDGPLDDAWSTHTFAVLAEGTVRYLGPSLRLIDAGDYDGDGRSELVFAFAKYDYDGYTLFWNRFERSASYGWIYH